MAQQCCLNICRRQVCSHGRVQLTDTCGTDYFLSPITGFSTWCHYRLSIPDIFSYYYLYLEHSWTLAIQTSSQPIIQQPVNQLDELTWFIGAIKMDSQWNPISILSPTVHKMTRKFRCKSKRKFLSIKITNSPLMLSLWEVITCHSQGRKTFPECTQPHIWITLLILTFLSGISSIRFPGEIQQLSRWLHDIQ